MKREVFLLVDDDQVFIDTLGRALEKKGFGVLKATCIADAERLAREGSPHYAVVDLKIDRESGLDCLKNLKRIHDGMRVLILTGYSSIATAVNAIKQGAVNYACKPLGVEDLLALIIEGHEQTDEPMTEPISVDRLEWEHIQRVLDENAGNISATARCLGMHRRTLQRKLSKRPVKR